MRYILLVILSRTQISNQTHHHSATMSPPYWFECVRYTYERHVICDKRKTHSPLASDEFSLLGLRHTPSVAACSGVTLDLEATVWDTRSSRIGWRFPIAVGKLVADTVKAVPNTARPHSHLARNAVPRVVHGWMRGILRLSTAGCRSSNFIGSFLLLP